MLRINRLTDYGIALLARIAKDPEAVVKAHDLAELSHIPLPTVSKLLKILTNKGILSSFRGAHGGYVLAQAPDDISIYEIIEIFEGPIAFTVCAQSDNDCELEAHCGVRQPWQHINHELSKSLRAISLAEIARRSHI